MGGLELLVLSVALGTDLFSVAIPIGMNRVRLRIILRAAVVFAVFHILMILGGYHLGHWMGHVVEHFGSYHSDCPVLLMENWASILGSLVLAGLGIHMIRESAAVTQPGGNKHHPLKGPALVVLAASVSVDALAAGFSLGMMDVDLLKLSTILGAVIFIIAILGLGLGRRAGRYLGGKSGLIGGTVLVALGIHVLWQVLT
ncbi:manganese efflux pump|uniref:Putative Mn2+ efflux pump MntP n=1 Tax=Dendrosporobacter quercicolus TaxID=146817 RepID=A0A1G9QS02_9FIRM|nr:manganese efflux pump [Dendrosporobacter quercicolus]NSL48343.1 manganese efflux pump [Dendrosporobacter quercicolus DSM 1736]SDM13766.1 Putative Mn2+ efflux pump MntP [Dendrosporobacter quercicolus]